MNNFALSQIGQIAIPVGDLERAVKFYQDKLGMKHIFTVPNQFTFFDCGGVRLLLGLPEKGETNRKTSLIYYTVNDIQEAYEILKKREVHFDDDPISLRRWKITNCEWHFSETAITISLESWQRLRFNTLWPVLLHLQLSTQLVLPIGL